MGWVPLLPALVAALLIYFIRKIPFVSVEWELQLVTDRSPAEVRDEFHGVDNPLAILAHEMTDEDGIDVHENGATYETTLLFGLRTVRTRYETEQYPNGDLLVRVWQNNSETEVSTVSVEPADSTGSLVTVEGERPGQVTLQLLLMIWVRDNQVTAAFEANGYEVISDETRVRLR